MDVLTLGTIASSANIAYKTLGKSLPRSLNQQQHVRRCSHFSFVSNLIDLFGAKSASDNLLSIIVKVTGPSVCESDGLPRKICWNCQQLSGLKDLCQRSRNPVSHKRGKKTEETQHTRVTQRNRTEIHSEAWIQNYEMPLESHAARKALYNSSKINSRLSAAELNQEMQILVFAIVTSVKLQDGIMFFSFWLCTYAVI